MRDENQNPLNLYRMMADVCAGSDQHAASQGEFGIVTVWVRAHSMSAAFAHAGVILDSQRYSHIGTLHGYAEQLVYDPLECTTPAERAPVHFEDRLLTRYDALKASALARGDGLHEVWLGDTGHHLVTKPDCAQAA